MLFSLSAIESFFEESSLSIDFLTEKNSEEDFLLPQDVSIQLSDNESKKAFNTEVKTIAGFNKHIRLAKEDSFLVSNYSVKSDNQLTFTLVPKALLNKVHTLSRALLNDLDKKENQLKEDYFFDDNRFSYAMEELSSISMASEQLMYQSLAPNNDLLSQLGAWPNQLSLMFDDLGEAGNNELNTQFNELLEQLNAMSDFE